MKLTSTTRSAAAHGATVGRRDPAKRRSALERLIIGIAALPFLFGIASAAEPLSDAQMDNLTAGRRGIATPSGANDMAVWWVVPDGAAPPFYWFGGSGWQSFLVTSLKSAAASGQNPALLHFPNPRGVALHR
jgi:hypothetical protein